MGYFPVFPILTIREKNFRILNFFSKIPEMDSLLNEFEKTFGSSAEFYVIAPGRVNLIGEHIDYCGYSVLPMAIEQSIKIIASINNDKSVNIKSTIPGYESFQGQVADLDKIDLNNLKWYNYITCGYKAIQETFSLAESVGLNLLVTGDIPMGAGL